MLAEHNISHTESRSTSEAYMRMVYSVILVYALRSHLIVQKAPRVRILQIFPQRLSVLLLQEVSIV